MDNNIDNKKVIQMVVIIGILCLFVGIVTRIRNNNLKTLADYEAPSQTAGTTTDSTIDGTTGSSSDDIDSNSESTEITGSEDTISGSSDSGAAANTSTIEISTEEYDAFYYVEGADGISTVYLLYYNNLHEVANGTLECSSDDAYELMLVFYKLYKNHYEFTSITPVSEFESEEAARLANNTYCIGTKLIINPYYNPSITYENDTIICIPSESDAYADRTSDFPYKITADDYAYSLLTEAGYYWGGNRNGSKDYASFEK